MTNAYILLILIRQLHKTAEEYRLAFQQGVQAPALEFRLEGGGMFFRLFKKLFRLIDRYVHFLESTSIYPLLESDIQIP